MVWKLAWVFVQKCLKSLLSSSVIGAEDQQCLEDLQWADDLLEDHDPWVNLQEDLEDDRKQWRSYLILFLFFLMNVKIIYLGKRCKDINMMS